MRVVSLSSLFLTLVSTLLLQCLGEIEQASSPPRGWNSYDSFCWSISEEEFLQNAELVAQRLRTHGFEYVVVDYLWYRRKVKGAYVDSLGFDVIDEWGRMMPDPDRWPSSRGGKGFTEVAKKVHGMGLKFGIHVMRGISTQAFNANTPVLDVTTGKAYEESGRQWRAKDIGMKERTCAWMKNGFMSVNTKLGAGRAFLRSLYQQYADWGVFCVTPAMGRDVNSLVNMYRITGDDWDTWGDVAAHFDISRDFSAANMIGAKGLRGKSWPDLDMLPFGWLTDQGSNEGPHRKCNLNLDEQRSQMTLWSMAKSPLMFGGDMRRLDDATFSLLTNPTLLEINSFSSNNKEFPYITNTKCRFHRVRNRPLRCKSRYLERNSVMGSLALGLTSCKDVEARGWSLKPIDDDDLDQVCWKEKSRNGDQEPFCLYKRKPLLPSDEYLAYKKHYDGKVHLLATKKTESCLGASRNQKLTSKESKRGSFSPCGWDANQMWELNHNGTLMNSYSGLCASMRQVKANSGSNGVRAWVATGRRGEIYVAFFNLDDDKAEVSMRIDDLAKAFPGKNFNTASCKCREEWSGEDFGVVRDSLSTQVEIHGCALFVLNCTYS
ncbi:UNVERIFIED_CONTAM: hypothetical protein Slati_3169300 [Sesamum latifolium]|uniref:Alpha-galactosidase n=1 Tax=Sesamum latifolium TaxID=2727402 RepID=A0AAW2UW60_9LAMI